MVARLGARVALHRDSVAAMKRSRAVVESALGDGRAHYGINTGFGSLSKQRISSSDLATLQRNLVRSHAAGVGPPLPSEVVRGMLLLLAASLGRGLSGVRPELAKTIVDVLNAGILPVVPVRLVFLGLVLACGATGGSGGGLLTEALDIRGVGGLWIAVVNFMGHGVKIRFFCRD